MSDKTDNEIKKLWKKMEDELAKLDPHDDWPEKSIVMRSPWHLEIHSYHEAWDEHETVLDFVRREAIRKEDFDESSLPPELLKYAKEEILYDDDKTYPNIISATASGDTLEEAIEEMRKKLHLLEHGYILMDTYFYREELLDEDNGSWMLEDDDEDDDDEFDIDDLDLDDDDDEEEDDEEEFDIDDLDLDDDDEEEEDDEEEFDIDDLDLDDEEEEEDDEDGEEENNKRRK